MHDRRSAQPTPPADQPSPPKPFNNVDPYAMRWSERARDLVNAGKLTISRKLVESIKVAVAEGECPYCGDYLKDVQIMTAVTEGSDGVLGRGVAKRTTTTLGILIEKYEDVTFTCGCGIAHPGGEKSKTGCGTFFRLPAPLIS